MTERLRKWEINLEKLRKKELDIVFGYFSGKHFSRVLEIGAGNGFQSSILADICDSLTVTDLNEDRLNTETNNEKIETFVADAEELPAVFASKSFNLVFSSNLLEHLPDIDKCLSGCHLIMKDDAVAVHIMPNTTWRALSFVLHYPVKMFRLSKRFATFVFPKKNRKILEGSVHQPNNMKSERRKNPMLDFIIPPPHGISKNVFLEFFAFRKCEWTKIFTRNNFEVIDVLSGPVSSGYGLGFSEIKRVLSKFGFTTEYIYVVRKLDVKHNK